MDSQFNENNLEVVFEKAPTQKPNNVKLSKFQEQIIPKKRTFRENEKSPDSQTKSNSILSSISEYVKNHSWSIIIGITIIFLIVLLSLVIDYEKKITDCKVNPICPSCPKCPTYTISQNSSGFSNKEELYDSGIGQRREVQFDHLNSLPTYSERKGLSHEYTPEYDLNM